MTPAICSPNHEWKQNMSQHMQTQITAPTPGFIFDLDGTLIDSVYPHVLAWMQAFDQFGIPVAGWRIHRRIGMSGDLFVRAIFREIGHPAEDDLTDRIQHAHGDHFQLVKDQVRPLPGAKDLLDTLTAFTVPWAIATSGHIRSASHGLDMLGILNGPAPVITRDLVKYAKPDPDLFLAAAVALDIPIATAFVIGDSVWDMFAAGRVHALPIGLRCGGNSETELRHAGAYRVFDDPADMLDHLDELGVRKT